MNDERDQEMKKSTPLSTYTSLVTYLAVINNLENFSKVERMVGDSEKDIIAATTKEYRDSSDQPKIRGSSRIRE